MKLFLYNLAVTLVGDSGTTGGTNVSIPQLTADQVVKNTLNIAYILAGIIAVIVIIVGGIMYSTSAGNSGSVGKAKNMILFSVVGLVVIFAAFAITNWVLGKF